MTLLGISIAGAQQPIGSIALGDLVQGLGVNTRVLVVGAHPDDEDTNLISWLARGRHVETAYLSLTRGEGGQNLIGNELGVALGQIRTEELLAARRIDGGRQYFTRAIDFGFSKTLVETSERWPRELILKDVVRVIRAFRPHVIVSVWSGTAADGHGHHQYSGVIAKEGFEAAADSTRFPGLGGMGPWSAAKFYRVARGQNSASANVRFNAGEYNPLLGRSYAEVAALSRSQHLSQGFGAVLPLGNVWGGIALDTSRVGPTRATDRSIFDGIDTTWGRFAGTVSPAMRPMLDSLAAATRDAQLAFDAVAPARLIGPLARVLRVARAMGGPAPDMEMALEATIDRAERALLLAAGVTVDVLASRERVALGDSVDVTVTIYNRGRSRVELTDGTINIDRWEFDLPQTPASPLTIAPDSAARVVRRVNTRAITRSWWLVTGAEPGGATYRIADDREGWMEVGEERLAESNARLRLRIDGMAFNAPAIPIVHRFADPAQGEQRHPVATVPRISVVLPDTVAYLRANQRISRDLRVQVVSASSAPDTVAVQLELPAGLVADSAVRRIALAPFGKAAVSFRVSGTVRPGDHALKARGVDRAGSYSEGYVEIDYSHIRPLRVYRPASIRVTAVDVRVPANLRVAYVRGVGDNVEQMLQQLGVNVRTIEPEAIAALDPATTSTLVVGSRALEAIDAVTAAAGAIQDFARRGGTVVVQYTQNATQPGILPFPVTLSRPAGRVTDERADVTLIDASHRLLATPNRITAADFGGWVQERGLYMPGTFDSRWTPLLEMRDPGEAPNRGGVLVASVGKGAYVYTSLSFFRQLPAGNAGAARLFVNLLSAGLRAGPTP